MPTYEYKCNTCGNHFERFQNMSDEPIKVCPECCGPATRLISAGAGVILKGSGFYAAEYKQQSGLRTRCGKENTCCGRDVPCDNPPCND